MNEWYIIQTALRRRMSPVLSPWKTLVPGNYQVTHQLLIKPFVTAHMTIYNKRRNRTMHPRAQLIYMDLVYYRPTCSWEITALLTKCCSCSLAKLIHSCSKLFTPRSCGRTQEPWRRIQHPERSLCCFSSFQISVHTEHQPQTRRCPLYPQCCPSLWDWASHWSAPATSQTAPNIRLWQWHLCKRYHNEEHL